MIAGPLFALLKKNVRWHWGAAEEHAFLELKRALQAAPVLGHPEQGRPYRLYTDASDEALGCALQQVQPIEVKDLKGSRCYERLRTAHTSGLSVPRLVTSLAPAVKDAAFTDTWGADLDSSSVHVERVIGYWSRTFKPAERNYSATEREALAAKEGLVKFQPFIEGEDIALVTDHAALQWAHTYENANRRLAAWGAVFSAYKPGLTICHRPGRVHSNVDPLSRLPRDLKTGEVRGPPAHDSPAHDYTPTLKPDNSLAAEHERRESSAPKATFAAEVADGRRNTIERSVLAVTRAQAKGRGDAAVREPKEKGKGRPDPLSETSKTAVGGARPASQPTPSAHETDERDLYERRRDWESENALPKPTLLVHMKEEVKQAFRDAYQADPAFASKWSEGDERGNSWYQGKRYFKDADGLLYFKDADFQPRLCVPARERAGLLRIVHESPFEAAHAGFERSWKRLAPVFYWPKMRRDVERFCKTCEVCQKTKSRNYLRYGFLLPNPIPHRPFEAISMDLIVGLPMSGEYNAIWVVVDRLTKLGIFAPTTSGIGAEEFALLFVKLVACRFGLPDAIISDRDPRWTHLFWKAVAQYLKTEMWLSSAHHPQHDGQTEIINRQVETMLRAYVQRNRADWAEYLPLIEHAYNSAASASTGTSPFFLLYGFHSRDSLGSTRRVEDVKRETAADAVEFLEKIESVRQTARDAIARSQEKQAVSYNKGRRILDLKEGDKVLIDPHALQWLESKGEGSKLAQRFIGPFAVQERVGPNTYRLDLPHNYPGLPIFNVHHLKPFFPSDCAWEPRATLPETRPKKLKDEEYQVEKVVGHRFNRKKGSVEFLVHWEGYSPLYDSWLSARDLRNASQRLFDYRSEHGL
ncbi:polyprotein [Phanerochaete sordida]|uniref:Polyprotein n=1 Tax=Phanerochaete sordida TaxID=48140 RepID=A0A9P3GTU7_9APHY|nr:polyprotein [Phanerochaete sordida]